MKISSITFKQILNEPAYWYISFEGIDHVIIVTYGEVQPLLRFFKRSYVEHNVKTDGELTIIYKPVTEI